MSETLKRAAAMLLAEANAIEDCHTRGDGDWTGEDEAKASHDADGRQPFCPERKPSEWQSKLFFRLVQAESERYYEQRDNLLRCVAATSPMSRSMLSMMAQEAIDAPSLTRSTRRTAAQKAGDG